MAFKELEYTQSVWHYQVTKRKFVQEAGKRVIHLFLQHKTVVCRRCGSHDVAVYKHRLRIIAGLPIGKCPVRFVVPVGKVVCHHCGTTTYEKVEFTAYKNARITRSLSQAFLDRAPDMSMKAIAAEFHVSWRTVRDAIEVALRKRYRVRDYSGVRNIGIDELYVFPAERPSRKYITIVRDVDSGKVLEVSRGKGAAALARFGRKIEPYRANVRSVSLDMSSSYNLWVAAELPNALAVIDHFHVIKALNDRVDRARRRVMGMVDEKTAKRIKGNRYLFLRNQDDLSARESARLVRAMEVKECSELAEMHLYKERMRAIYAKASNLYEARPMIDEWLRDAAASDVAELRSAARTFARNREGILAYWKCGGRNNAATEGFNRKIRGLLEKAYGFHDYKFLRLRIFDLGERRSIIG